jgi:hypothetical protein
MSLSTGRLRVAILAHSTSPRGGVVHALELGDALVRLGHEAVVRRIRAASAFSETRYARPFWFRRRRPARMSLS